MLEYEEMQGAIYEYGWNDHLSPIDNYMEQIDVWDVSKVKKDEWQNFMIGDLYIITCFRVKSIKWTQVAFFVGSNRKV